MADSTITKKALAHALKQLMEEMPFAKISVSDICEKCSMNRTSFYYHFKDKYDLLNWIYDTECVLPLRSRSYAKAMEVLPDICRFLYDNRDFYRKAFQVKGQNSFSAYFQETMEPLLAKASEKLFAQEADREFYLTFFAGSFISAIERWIQDENCIPVEDFLRKSRSCFICIYEKLGEFYS